MFKNFIPWIVFAGTLALSVTGLAQGFSGSAGRSQLVEISVDVSNEILAATIQILILEPQRDFQFAQVDAVIPDGVNARARLRIRSYDADLGLGTLIAAGGEVWILSHNHWNPRTDEARVQFLDAAGNLLLELDNQSFSELVRYEDPGTLLLQAPDQIAQRRSAKPLPAGSVDANEIVHLVRRVPEDPFVLEVLAAELVQFDQHEEARVLKLRTLDGQAIVRGDSGGGVWLDGKLAGNLWLTEVNQGLGWESLSSLELVERPTDRSTAAEIPSGLFGQSLAQNAGLGD